MADERTEIPRDLVVLTLSLFTWGVGEGMFVYFQAIYLQRWGANPLQIGAILSMAGIASAATQIPAGYLTDRIGSRPVMWFAWVLGVIATIMMASATTLGLFIAGMLIYSLTSFVNVPLNSYISSIAASRAGARWSVERSITIVSALMHLGTFFGPLIGGLLAESLGLPNVYRISTGLFIISTVIVFMARHPPVEEPVGSRMARRALVFNPRFLGLLVLITLTMFAMYLPQPFAQVYLKNQQGYSLQTIGMLGAASSLGNAVIMMALGGLRAPVGLLVGQMLAGLFALIMWRSTSLPLFFAGYFVLGGYRLCRSMALAYSRRLVHAGETGLAFGLIETANAVSVIAAPVLAGFLYARSPALVFIAGLVATVIMLLVNYTFLPGRHLPEPVSGAEQTKEEMRQSGTYPIE